MNRNAHGTLSEETPVQSKLKPFEAALEQARAEDAETEISFGVEDTVVKHRGLVRKAGRVALIAAATGGAMIGGLGLAWNILHKSGEITQYPPLIHRAVPIDDVLRVGSWNMQGKARTRYKQIGQLMHDYDLDAMDLQEVTAEDAESLHERFPSLYVNFVLGDIKQHVMNGGYGNLIITRQKPEDVKSISFAGTSFWGTLARGAAGITEDAKAASSSFANTKAGLQESRAAIAATIKVLIGDRLVDVRLVTSHIAGRVDPGVHDQQFKKLLDFTKDNTEHGRLTVVCADENAGEEEANPAWTQQGFITAADSASTSLSGKKIDHCSYYLDGTDFGLGAVQVVEKDATDHHPIVFTIRQEGL